MKRSTSGSSGAGRGAQARPRSAGPTASAAEAIAKVSPARAAAFEVLTLVGEGKGHSDELLHLARVTKLSSEDRNLTTALVMGVLRWQIALDAGVRKLLSRPDQRLAEPVALALRLGAFQLLHMDRIPPHAALNESVELCRAAGHPHAAGLVNAVLRKVAAAPKRGTRVERPDEGKSTAAFAERLAHPLWLVERWAKMYGREAALSICEYDQREPAGGGLFADENTGTANDFFAPAGAADQQPHPQMDDGSRLVAELAAATMPAVGERAARVWDCCAAPGGKTLVLARRLAGAEILASDVSAKRLAQMTTRLRRYDYAERVRTSVTDASDASVLSGPAKRVTGEDLFDLILCDVPCSGTGTLARNPEIRLRLRPEELARQAARQRAILSGALAQLAPGGKLVYSTCSLEPEENERVVEIVEAAKALFGLRRVSVEPLIALLAQKGILRAEVAKLLMRSAVKDGALRTLPGVHGCDGFYATVLEKGL